MIVATAPAPRCAARRRKIRGQRLARCGAIAVAAWLAGACNQALGLDPVALHGDASNAPGDAVDAAAVCVAGSAEDVPGGAAVDGTFANGLAGAARFGSRVFLVGARDGRSIDGGLAAIDFPTPDGTAWTTRKIGGAADDQIWTVAGTGAEFLAGGVTRSYQTSGLDEGLLLQADATGTLTSRRLRAGLAIQIRAVAAATPGEWWIAGTAGDSAGLLVRATSGGTVLAGVNFTIDGGRPVPRRVVESPDDSAAPFGVGVRGGGTEPGFVARVDSTPTSGLGWAVTVPMEVFDAAWFDASLWVAGSAGADGVLLQLDAAGALRAAWRLPGRPLHRVAQRGATTWLGGATSSGVFVATLAGDCVTGTDLAGLAPAQPLRAPLPLEVDGAVPFVVGRVGTVARVIPLGEDGAATCGVPFAAVREPATITATAATHAGGAPLALFYEPVSAIGAAVAVADQATSCP